VKALTPTLSQRERGSLRAPAQAFTLPPAQAFTLWLRSADFHAQRHAAAGLIRTVLDENPHTTLQVVLEPTGDAERLTIATLAMLLEACYRTTSYLDRYYSLHPGRLLGAKRLLILLPAEKRAHVHPDWISATAEYATLVWHGGSLAPGELLEHECAIL